MKALVRIHSMDSATPTTEARLEFYQIGMLLDELGSDCQNQTAQFARVEIFEQGHLTRSFNTCIDARLKSMISRY